MSDTVWVVAFDKKTGLSKTVTSCGVGDSTRIAKYYRGIGYNARILTYDQVLDILQKESDERCKRYSGVVPA